MVTQTTKLFKILRLLLLSVIVARSLYACAFTAPTPSVPQTPVAPHAEYRPSPGA